MSEPTQTIFEMSTILANIIQADPNAMNKEAFRLTYLIAARSVAVESEVGRLRERLEIAHVFDGDGNKLPFPKGMPDGIDCRDATIKLLEEEIERIGKRADAAEDLAEKQADALSRISGWAEAYPLKVFPDQELKRANEVLEAAGISMSAMHGQWARHIVEGIGKLGIASIFAVPIDPVVR